MVMTGDNTCVTSLRPTFKAVACGKQKPYWLELQFVDENNQPVSGLKVQLEYHPLATAAELALWARGGHTRFDPTPPPNPPAGVTDIQGLVRFDDLYWIAVDVKTDGQQLADIMEQRPLGLRRNPNSQPVSGNAFRRETRDKTWRSDVQEKAEAVGYLTHYRHVNDNDLVPQIPPEVDMDSELYEKLGWLGDKLGFDWLATSAIGLLPRTFGGNAGVDMGITQERDPYWHHGKTVLFLRAEQSVMKSGERNTLWIGGGTVSYTEKAAVKRYLVPSLNEECLKSTGEHQAAFIQCLAPGELEKRFPQRENVASAGLFTKPLNHFMASKYLPYIHNQVLELADPARDMDRKAMRTLFREAVEQKANFSNPDEVERNREFLALQDMLRFTLSRLQTEETGKNALLRFAAVTEEEVELPN
ncbi:hypothetical protein AG21_21235 [Salmonella enterica subsp. arizonae]|nr:hypothetical protein [Salmonella enterica]ECC9442667.1 hypothetical protein [Salmonella enterica subsp. arizonae]